MLFAREGADVAIVYLSEHEDARGNQRAMSRSEGRRCLLIAGDVTRLGVLRGRRSSRRCAEFGQLDVLVNNAAFQEHAESIEDITDEQLDQTFRTNIYGYFHMAQAAVPHLKEGGASSIPVR